MCALSRRRTIQTQRVAWRRRAAAVQQKRREALDWSPPLSIRSGKGRGVRPKHRRSASAGFPEMPRPKLRFRNERDPTHGQQGMERCVAIAAGPIVHRTTRQLAMSGEMIVRETTTCTEQNKVNGNLEEKIQKRRIESGMLSGYLRPLFAHVFQQLLTGMSLQSRRLLWGLGTSTTHCKFIASSFKYITRH